MSAYGSAWSSDNLGRIFVGIAEDHELEVRVVDARPCPLTGDYMICLTCRQVKDPATCFLPFKTRVKGLVALCIERFVYLGCSVHVLDGNMFSTSPATPSNIMAAANITRDNMGRDYAQLAFNLHLPPSGARS